MLSYYLLRRVHASWMLAIACVGILVGVTLAQVVSPGPLTSISWLLAGSGAIVLSAWRGQQWLFIMALVGGIAVGLWRGSLVQVDIESYRPLMNQQVTLTGKVLDDVELDARGRTVIRLGDIIVDQTGLPGSIWVTAKENAPVRRSDIVELTGRLQNGFGSFTGVMYDAKLVRVSRERPGDIALMVRDRFAEGVAVAIREPEASLGLGYLAGMRRGLPEQLDTALLVTGLTHIVVASGYNLTILIRLARRTFEKISKYMALLVSGGLITGFIAVTGVSPSMARAGLVAGLALAAWYYGRRFHPLVLLPFAMAITVLIQPSYAWGDVGWQLSFAAFAGVMLMAPLVSTYLFGDRPEKPLRRIMIETISAQLFTLPILLVTFGSFSLIAPLANLLILPLVPLAMLLTFLAGCVGLVAGPLAAVFGLPAQWVLTYMTQTIMLTGSLEWAQQPLPISLLVAAVMYGCISAACLWMWRITRLDLRRTSLVE